MVPARVTSVRSSLQPRPTGITPQPPWLSRGLDPTLKAARRAHYVVALRKAWLAVSRACAGPLSGTAPTRCSSSCEQILRSLGQIRIGMMT